MSWNVVVERKRESLRRKRSGTNADVCAAKRGKEAESREREKGMNCKGFLEVFTGNTVKNQSENSSVSSDRR